jgi:hypothetical protein
MFAMGRDGYGLVFRDWDNAQFRAGVRVREELADTPGIPGRKPDLRMIIAKN